MTEEEFRPWRRHALAPEVLDASDVAWSCFETYLVAGPGRNLGRVARERRILLEQLHRWSQEGHWRARCEAYDTHLEAVRDEAIETSVSELARMASGLAALGAREVQLLARVQASLDRPGVIRPNDAIRALDRGITLLQLLGGRPTERVAAEDLDLSVLSDSELETLMTLRAKMTS